MPAAWAAGIGAIGAIASSAISSSASSKPTVSKSTTTIPKSYQSLMDSVTGQASQGMAQPYQSYTLPRIAPLSPNEQQGINQAGDNNGMYQDLINMSMMNNASSQAGGGLPQPGEINNLINPYVDYVLGNSLNRLNEQSDINRTKIGSLAGMSGAFGGSRHGVLEGTNLAELLRSTSELSSNTYSDAYDKGMGNWFKGQDLLGSRVADGMNIAGAGSKYNTQDIANLMDTGKVGRTRDQGLFDFTYGDFMQDREYPWQQAGRGTSILQGHPSQLFDSTNSGTGPQQPANYAASGIGGALVGLGLYNQMPSFGSSGGASGSPTLQAKERFQAKGGLVKKASYADGGYVKGKVGDDFNPIQTKPAHEIEYIMDMLGLGSTNSLENDLPEFGDVIGDLSYVQETNKQTNRMKKTTKSNYIEDAKYLNSRLNRLGVTHSDLERVMQKIQADKEAQRLIDQNQKVLTRDTQIRQPKYALGGDVTTQDQIAADPLAGKGMFGMLRQSFYNKPHYGIERDDGTFFETPLMQIANRFKGPRKEKGKRDAVATPPRPAFDFASHAERMGLNQLMNAPVNTPRVPSSTPDLSMFMQQLQQRTQGQGQGQVNPNLPTPSVYAAGGKVKGFYEGDFVTGGKGNNFINSLPSEEDFGNLLGLEDRAFDKALKKHESAAKDFENPRYNANYFVENKGTGDSHAFGIGQWQPGTWNTFALKNKHLGLPIVKSKDIENGILPSKEHQNIMFSVWTKDLASRHGNDYVGRWAEHQAGRGGQLKLYNADPNEKVREVLSLRQARNIGAYNDTKGRKKRDETVAQYFERVKGYFDTAKDYETNKVHLSSNTGAFPEPQASSPLDYLAQISTPITSAEVFKNRSPANMNTSNDNVLENTPSKSPVPVLEADTTPYKEYPTKELSLDEIINKYSTGDFTKGGKGFKHGGIVGFAEGDKIKRKRAKEKGTAKPITLKLNEPLDTSRSQTIDSLLMNPRSKSIEEILDEFSPFSEGSGYPQEASLSLDEIVDKYSVPNTNNDAPKNTRSGQDVYHDAVNASRKGMGLDPFPKGQWSVNKTSWGDVAQEAKAYADEAGANTRRIADAPYTSTSRMGRIGEDMTKGLGMAIPFINQGIGKTVQGSADALGYLFDPIKEPTPSATTASGKYSLGPLGILGTPSAGGDDVDSFWAGLGLQEPSYEASTDNLTDAVEDGTGGGGLKTHNDEQIASKDDEVTAMLKEYIATQLKDLKNTDQDPDNNDPLKSLFGNYNQGLFKMGMSILANTGSSKNDMEALAKGILGSQESEEAKALAKVERKNQRIKDLLNVRYLDAMTNQMTPESRMAIAKENNRADYNKMVEQKRLDREAARERFENEGRSIGLKVGLESLGTGQPINPRQLENIRKLVPGFAADEDVSDLEGALN